MNYSEAPPGEKVRNPKLRTLVVAFAFHLADLLGMDEGNEETVKKYHKIIDDYEKKIEDSLRGN